MGVTAQRSKELGLIDTIIEEPIGGAHRDHVQMAERLKQRLADDLQALLNLDSAERLEQRYQKLMSFWILLSITYRIAGQSNSSSSLATS